MVGGSRSDGVWASAAGKRCGGGVVGGSRSDCVWTDGVCGSRSDGVLLVREVQ